MKSMVVLIDTNVLLDFLLHRRPFDEEANRIMKSCAEKSIHGYMAFHSVSNIFYVLRKYADEETRRLMLRDLLSVVTVTAANHDEVLIAVNRSGFKDFEDCLQDACAKEVGADYIITRNGKDFEDSVIPAISPKDFLEVFDNLSQQE